MARWKGQINAYIILIGNLKEIDRLENLHVNGRLALK